MLDKVAVVYDYLPVKINDVILYDYYINHVSNQLKSKQKVCIFDLYSIAKTYFRSMIKSYQRGKLETCDVHNEINKK